CDDTLRLRRSDLASENFRLKLEIPAHERAVEQRNERNREELRQKIKAVLCRPDGESPPGECPSPGIATSNCRQRKKKSKRRSPKASPADSPSGTPVAPAQPHTQPTPEPAPATAPS